MRTESDDTEMTIPTQVSPDGRFVGFDFDDGAIQRGPSRRPESRKARQNRNGSP
jgi:hypothetical protein